MTPYHFEKSRYERNKPKRDKDSLPINKETLQSCGGFTLVETLTVIAILGLVIGAVYGAYTLSQRAYREGETLVEITQNGRVILERMTREIRQAREIVTELPEEESAATSTIMFEDGHVPEPYHYIHYFKKDDLIKREVIRFYFSGDSEETPVPWDSDPPSGQTLETKTLEESQVIGEYIADLKFFAPQVIYVALVLEKKDKTLQLRTAVFGRNL